MQGVERELPVHAAIARTRDCRRYDDWTERYPLRWLQKRRCAILFLELSDGVRKAAGRKFVHPRDMRKACQTPEYLRSQESGYAPPCSVPFGCCHCAR